jgi:hypothetical protein
MPRTKAQPIKKQRVSEEVALPLDETALLAHAERVVQQLEANEIEQWEKCVATPSCHIDFAAVPAAAAGLVKVVLSAEHHAVFCELHDTIVDLHQGEAAAAAAPAPVPATPVAAAPAPTPGESEPAPEPTPEPAPEPAPAPAPAAASADKAMTGWGGTDDRSGRQRCYGYVDTPLGLQHFAGSHAMREYSGDKAEVDRTANRRASSILGRAQLPTGWDAALARLCDAVGAHVGAEENPLPLTLALTRTLARTLSLIPTLAPTSSLAPDPKP